MAPTWSQSGVALQPTNKLTWQASAAVQTSRLGCSRRSPSPPPTLGAYRYSARHIIHHNVIQQRRCRQQPSLVVASAAANAAEPPFEAPKLATTTNNDRKHSKLLITALLVVVTGIANRVLYKMALTPLQDYVFFLAQLQTFGYVAVYFGFLLLRIKNGRATTEMLNVPKTYWVTFLAIGFVEALSSLLSFIGASRLPGIVLPLLSQSIMLWQVLLAYLTGRRLSISQLLGVSLVLAGVVMAGWPAHPGHSPLTGIDPAYAALFVISMFFPAVDTLLKERVFKVTRKANGQDLDLFVVNSFGSLSQALFVFLLLPVVTAVRGMNVHQLPGYLIDGWSCFRGITPSCGGDCTGAPFLPLLYVGFNLAFNICTLNLIRQSGNVVVSLVMSAIVPCTLYAFTLPLPYLSNQPKLGPSFIFGAATLMLGLLIYNMVLWWPYVKRKIKEFVEEEADNQGGGGPVGSIVAK